MAVWWLFAFIAAFAARVVYSGSEFVVLGAAFFLQKQFYRSTAPLKSELIRSGDRIEFAQDQENSYIQKFQDGKVLRRMRGEDVVKTGLFEEELIPLYHHFYLVEMDDKNIVVPYEWVLSIDFEDLLDEDTVS